MGVLNPVYLLIVYAPRSTDTTEATELSPAAGAPHSDPFVVASAQNISVVTHAFGTVTAKPYLFFPSARSATIDPLTKKTTGGTITIEVGDVRTAAGGSNANRWASAFLGDGAGGNALIGRKVVLKESTDGGTTLNTIWTGRVGALAAPTKLKYAFTVRDLRDDLNQDIFVGAPHSSVSGATGYANLAQIAPLGLLYKYADIATVTTPLRGTTVAATGNAFRIDVDRTNGNALRTIITQSLINAGYATMARPLASDNYQRPKVMIGSAGAALSTFVEYDLDWFPTVSSGVVNELGTNDKPDVSAGTTMASLAQVFAVKSTKAGAAAPPAGGTSIDFYIIDPNAQPSPETPLLINDVDPITYLSDLCAGKYSRLDAAGAVIRSVGFSSNGISLAQAPPWRRYVTGASKLFTEIEMVCQAYHVAYYLDGTGTVQLVDLRRSATLAPAVTLTDADLDSPSAALSWQQDGATAITGLLGTYYPERQLTAQDLPKPWHTVPSVRDLPNVPTVGMIELKPQKVLVPQIGPRSGDVKPNAFKVDAKGFRIRIGTSQGDAEGYTTSNASATRSSRADRFLSHFRAYEDEINGMFGLGAAYAELVYRRASTNVALATQGSFVALNHTALPNPATNTKGGTRLGFVISRTIDGLRVKLRVIDAGANSVAVVPTFGTPAVFSGGSNVGVSLPVTLNASSEPVRVRYAITDQTVAVRPVDTDPSWIMGPLVSAAGTATVGGLPPGARIWLSARSVPSAGAGFKLPSAWAYPATAYIDLTAWPAPTGPAITSVSSDQQDIGWTNGDATQPVEIFLVAAGSAPSPWPDSDRVDVVLPGTVKYRFKQLAAATTYTAGIRHRDVNGGLSSMAAVTFTTPGSARVLSAPTTPTAFAGTQQGSRMNSSGSYGLAVRASELPGTVSFEEAVETAVGSGAYGSYTVVAEIESVAGDWTKWIGIAPRDGLRRKLQARHVGTNVTSSAYTTAQVIDPWTVTQLPVLSTAGAPFAWIELDTTEDDTSVNLILEGALGATGYGHLDWQYRISTGSAQAAWPGAWTTASDLPYALNVVRLPKASKRVQLRVKQGDGQITTSAEFTVEGAVTAISRTTGTKARGVAADDGSYDVASSSSDGYTAHASVKDTRTALLSSHGRLGVDTLDNWLDATYGKPLTSALTSGQVDLGKGGVIGKTSKNLSWVNACTGWTPSQSGLTLSGAGVAAAISSDLTNNAWETDTSTPGAFLLVIAPGGAAVGCDQCRIFVATAGGAATYKVFGSNDGGTTTTDLVTGWTPDQEGWNAIRFPRVSYSTYGIILQNTPGAGPWYLQIEFADSQNGGLSHHATDAGALLERVLPTIASGTGAQLQSRAKDARAALLNNHFRYGTDGAAGVVESTTQSFIKQAYLDGSRRPVTLYDPTLTVDVAGNDINVGQSRARGGFTNATGALATTAQDSRAALVNGMFRSGTDTSASVVETAGQKFVNGTALDGSRNVDFSAAGVVSRYAAYVSRSSSNATALATIVGQLADTGHAGSGMQDSRTSLLNNTGRLGVDAISQWPDGGGYGKTLSTALTSGQVDLGNAGVIGKYGTNVLQSAGNPVALSTMTSKLDNSGHAGSAMQDSRTSLLNNSGRLGVDAISQWIDGGGYGKTLSTALTSGQVDLANSGVIGKTSKNLSWVNACTGWTPSQSGLSLSGSGVAAAISSDLTNNAWYTDTSVPGAFLLVTSPGSVAVSCDQCRIFVATAGGAATYKVFGSNDGGTSTTDLVTGWTPDQQGWNAIRFSRVSYSTYGIILQNTPGAGPWYLQIEFADSQNGGLSHHATDVGALLERVLPTIASGVGAQFQSRANDSRSSLLNNHGRMGTDTVAQWVDGGGYGKTTTAQVGYADRAGTALDSNSRLTDQKRLVMQTVGNLRSNQFLPSSSTVIANPVSATATSPPNINIAAHDLYVGSSTPVSYAAQSSTGSFDVDPANPSTLYTNYVYMDDPTYAGGSPTPIGVRDLRTIVNAAGRYYVGKLNVSYNGTSSGGGGGGCPDQETPILMNDGMTMRAGDLRRGHVVRTRHETTGIWGYHVVEAVRIFRARNRRRVTLADGRVFIATSKHRVAVRDRGWVELRALRAGDVIDGERPGTVADCVRCGGGPAVQITVDGAHTYISAGLLSHNSKQP